MENEELEMCECEECEETKTDVISTFLKNFKEKDL